jgi:eukaryotic-like serine/threonine-protein kinase
VTTDLVAADLLEVLRQALGASYQVERELGGGGMSRLFVARETALDRRVVVKVLPPDLASRASAIRFQREVAVTVQLQHPHVIPVLTAGAHDDILYYVTPFIEGETLRQRLDRERRIPVAEALGILREVADAIAFAHTQGVVHRDIKPENILLTRGHVYVADFGIARALDEAAEAGRLTRPGSGIGTYGYMAPEQAAGRHDVDARADVYALAVLAYEMLTGEIPLPGLAESPRLPWRQPAAYAKLPSDVPRRVREAIAKGLAADPASRLRTAAEFHRALAPETGARFRPWRALAVGAGALAIVALAMDLEDRGVFSWPTPRSSGLDSNVVVFLPFDVLVDDAALGRAIPSTLRSAVDGAGPLRAMLHVPTGDTREAGRSDAAAAAAVARRVGARFVVVGQVAGAGLDSLRIDVSLVDAAATEVTSRFTVTDAQAQSGRLIDNIVRRLLEAINRIQPVTAVRAGGMDARTGAELWWFLRGERYLRTNDEDSAEVAYNWALANGDSTSVIGLRRLSIILRGLRSEWNDTAMAYAVRAGAMNRGLGPRDSMLVLADSLYGAIIRAPGDPRRADRMRRWFRTLEAAARAYPIDAEVHYHLGEAQFHFGHRTGVDPEAVLATLERSARLDPGFAPPYYHAIPLAIRHRSRDSALRLVERYLIIRPDDGAHRFIAALLRRGDGADPAAALDTMSIRDLQRLVFQLRTWPDSDRVLRRVFAELDRRRAGLGPPPGRSDVLHSPRAVARAAFRAAVVRGRLGEALRIGGLSLADLPADELVWLARFGAVPDDTARALFEGWLLRQDVERTAAALRWWADRRDRDALRRARALGDARPRADTSPDVSSMLPYTAAAAAAYLALLDVDTTTALRRFATLPDTLCAGRCPPDQLFRAELLLEGGHARMADSVLRAHPPNLDFPGLGEGLWWLARARAARALGDRDDARAHYALVAALWADADPTLAPLVSEAVRGAGGAPRPHRVTAARP